MSAGIYRWVVRRSNKPDLFYIGQAINLDRRKVGHLTKLRAGAHDNARLAALFRAYGERAFVFETLLICDRESLEQYEQALLDFYLQTFGRRVLNICRVCARSPRGVKRSAATLKRLSALRNRPGLNPRLGTKGKGANCKPVICVETGAVFSSIGLSIDWLREAGWPKANIAAVSLACNGVRESAYGYRWKFAPLVDTGQMLNSVDYEVKT